jgi:hypothetical protein
MKHNLMLTITSLLTILLMTLHLTSDTIHAKVGTPEAGGSTLIAVPILVIWLYGTLVLAERRSGYIIMLVGSLIGLGMPVLHVMGAGGVFHGQIAKSSLLVRLDAARARRDWSVLPHPLSTRTVEPATGPASVVEEPWNDPSAMRESSSSYLQSTLLSCEAAICHLPLRFNQVSVQTWHCFASGCALSLPMACSLP